MPPDERSEPDLGPSKAVGPPRARTTAIVHLCAIEVAWLDPLDAFERVSRRRWPILLDSAGPVGALARWSLLACDPLDTLVVRGATVLQDRRFQLGEDPLAALRALAEVGALDPADGAVCDGERPPFVGGLMGFLAYDAAELFERIPEPADPTRQVPDVAFGRYAAIVAFDRVRSRAWAIGSARDVAASAGAPDRRAVARSRALAIADLVTVAEGSRSSRPGKPAPAAPAGSRPRPLRAANRTEVEASIARVIDYVHAGDVFQANLSQAFDLDLRAGEDAAAVYRLVRERTPAPFGAVLSFDGIEVVSASPERFLRSDGDEIEARPIKGTRPRQADPALDRAEAAALVASAKDRSENVMIVDLMRNDLSRICRNGSVRVEALCALESHPTVHHLVSTVRGRLQPGVDPVDVLQATFPAGSITGAPKVRAMEIIAELEGRRRGVYCGAIGYIGLDGRLDFNVAIRTIVLHSGRAEIRAGGGIVADSTPAGEYEEMLDKARALLEAFRIELPAPLAPVTAPAPGLARASARPDRRGPTVRAGRPRPRSSGAERSGDTDGPAPGIGADAGGAHAGELPRLRAERVPHVLIIDNYDSFVHTIARYVRELGADAQVVRNDATSLDGIAALAPTHIVVSPGPCTPHEAGISIELVRRFGPSLPILGICLGHQAIAAAYGGTIVRGAWPAHGPRALVRHRHQGILAAVPSPLRVGRYHSLVVDPTTLPCELEIIAEDETGVVMALQHRTYPTTGLQFHPESVMSDHGHAVLAAFLARSSSEVGALSALRAS